MTTVRALSVLAICFCQSLLAATYEPSTVAPPQVAREFRGAWITTVANLGWPSQPGLSVEQQKAELLALLDRAAGLKLNAVVFQVRPACDAMYASRIEPWSEYLTGAMGRAPEPFYDPLAFAVEQAHKRGLELHAWFNPYRALHHSNKSPVATNHISKTRPELVRRYGRYLWLDPGERDVRDYIVRVVMDVVHRYDVDGIHFDDYFYPEPVTGPDGKRVDFPDEASWKRFGAGGNLNRDDWRRENVNAFIERTYNTIRSAKPWVKFGVSPHGIWRPGNPPQIRGGDHYSLIYADSRKWLANGWLDYFSPQLYWPIAEKEHSFPVLLDWWNAQNSKRRHIWPGLNTYKVLETWKPDEIVAQVRLTEKQPVSAGQIHFDMRPIMANAALQTLLARGPYAEPALVPASPWMGRSVTNKPVVVISGLKGQLRFTARPARGEQASRLVVQMKSDGRWTTELVPGSSVTRIPGEHQPDAIAVTAIDRFGNSSPPAVWERNR